LDLIRNYVLMGLRQPRRPGVNRGTVGAGRGPLVGTDRQDALHRAVGRIPNLQRATARGIEPLGTVPLAQTDDGLRGAQVVQRVIGQQPDDQLGDVLTQSLCAGAAPDRGVSHRSTVGATATPSWR
jgi:hypothetical protein